MENGVDEISVTLTQDFDIDNLSKTNLKSISVKTTPPDPGHVTSQKYVHDQFVGKTVSRVVKHALDKNLNNTSLTNTKSIEVNVYTTTWLEENE